MPGFKKNSPGCNCCPPITNCQSLALWGSSCGHDASIYQLAAAGIANDNCGDCSPYNGNFDLAYSGDFVSVHTWESPASGSTACGHSAGDPLWRLEYDGTGDLYTLYAVGLGYEYTCDGADWICFGDNVMTVMASPPSPNPCSMPATLTLESCYNATCDRCTGAPPSTVSVTLANWQSYNCDCSDMNATFILQRRTLCEWDGVWETYCGYSGLAAYITIWAKLQENDEGNTQWRVHAIYSNLYYDPWFGLGWRTTSVDYIWDSGTPGDIDCSATRVAAFESYHYGGQPCVNAGLTTCQIN